MTGQLRILVTGSRAWTDARVIGRALAEARAAAIPVVRHKASTAVPS